MPTLRKLLPLAGRRQCGGFGMHRHCRSPRYSRGRISRHFHPAEGQSERSFSDRKAKPGVHFPRQWRLLDSIGKAQSVRRIPQPVELCRLAEILRSHSSGGCPGPFKRSAACSIRPTDESIHANAIATTTHEAESGQTSCRIRSWISCIR